MDAKLVENFLGEDLQQIQRCDENMAFVSLEPNELTPMQQNLRMSVIDNLPAVIVQSNILETSTNMRRKREVAEAETSERLKNGAEELEKSHVFISRQNAEYKKLIELLKEAENDVREVMSGIENEDEYDEDDELAALGQNFQALKADLKYVLQTLCPVYKEDIEKFLRMLESDEDGWLQVPEDINSGAIMLLLRCKIIVQHPEQSQYFKWAPFLDI